MTTTDHSNEVIEATAMIGGQLETRFFKNGPSCAAYLGCSHALVYNAINKRGSARKARGWELKWVPAAGKVLDDEEA